LGFVAFMVGDAMLVVGVVGAGDAVTVGPRDMSPDIAVAVCPWHIVAASAPRATMPLAAIAVARHVSGWFSTLTPPFRSFAGSPPTKRSFVIRPRPT
jgi:hypothetical protein